MGVAVRVCGQGECGRTLHLPLGLCCEPKTPLKTKIHQKKIFLINGKWLSQLEALCHTLQQKSCLSEDHTPAAGMQAGQKDADG